MNQAASPLLTAKKLLARAGLWVLISAVFLDVSIGRIHDMRAAGQPVSPLRYAQIVFWIVVLAFWAWNAWRSWQQFSRERKVV